MSIALDPAPSSDEPDDAFGWELVVSVALKAGVAVTLGEASAVGSDHQREVTPVGGILVVESFIEEDLAGG